VPEDGTFSGPPVDQDIGSLVGTVFSDDQAAGVYPGSFEALPLDFASEIVADRTDVFRPETQTGATYDRRGHLATRAQHFLAERDLPRVRREFV
jgi:hypothetical protein